jgi:hypothetical protein
MGRHNDADSIKIGVFCLESRISECTKELLLVLLSPTPALPHGMGEGGRRPGGGEYVYQLVRAPTFRSAVSGTSAIARRCVLVRAAKGVYNATYQTD